LRNISLRPASLIDSRRLDILLQDELCHPSLIRPNRRRRPASPPIVTVVHQVLCDEPRPSWQNRIFRLVEKRYLDDVDGFVFNSRTTRDTVWGLTPNNRPHVVAPPGGDRLGCPMTPEAISERSFPAASLRLLFLGNVISRKGLLPLIASLAGLPRQSWELRVVGRMGMNPGHARRVLQEVWSRKLADRVRFLGRLEGLPLTRELSRAQVLCMPFAYEGFGMATLEAQAFGLPVIGSLKGATREIVQDGFNGFLVGPNDLEAVRSAVSALNDDRELLMRMSLAARRSFDRHPSWNTSMERLAAFLEALGSSDPRPVDTAIGPNPETR
jgi:glycosyltransferase involved in cell wall biosynthesis